MQAFELYINPKKKDDLFLSSFIYEPENIYEKRLGNLYIIGELYQALPQNSHFLNNLSSTIKKEYYSAGLKKSCELSLQEALKRGNEFLDKESKRGNLDWLGNLNFAVISFKDPVLNFAKVGDVKILLIRGTELIDLSQSLETELPNQNPLKTFGSMAAGKLSENDKIIILNKDVFSAISKNKDFLNHLCSAADEKKLKQILKTYKETIPDVPGVCLFLTATEKKGSKKIVTLRKDLPRFSFHKTLFKPIILRFYKIWKRPEIKLRTIKTLKIKIPKAPKIRIPKTPNIQMLKIKLVFNKKKILLVIGLIAILLLFFFIFGEEKKQELKEAQQKLLEVRAKIIMAENFLVLKDEEKANALFKEALEIVIPLSKRKCPVWKEALPIKKSIEQNLK